MRHRRSRRRRCGALSRLTGAASFIAFLSLVVISALSVRTLLTRASANLPVYLRQGLQDALHREVRVKSVTITGPGTVRLEGLAVAAGKTFRDGELLSVSSASVEYRIWDLLRGRVSPIGGIKRVSIDEPSLLIVRHANNRFNLQDLFAKRRKPPKPSPFRGVVTIHNAHLRFVDYAVRDLPTPQTNVLTVQSATLDAGGPPLMVVTASARGGAHGVEDANGTGSINPEDGSFLFRIVAKAGDASYWYRYFVRMKDLQVRAGSGIVTVDVFKPRAFTKVASTIRIDFRHGVASSRFVQAPIEDGAGRIVITTGRPLNISMDLRGRTAGMPVTLRGSVFTGKDARVALRATASGVQMASLRQALSGVPSVSWFQPQTPGTVSAQIYGAPRDLEATGQVQISSLKLYTAQVDGVRSAFRWRQGVVEIPTITGMMAGGPVTGKGWVNLRTHTIRVEAGGGRIETRDLAPSSRDLLTTAAAHVVVTGTTKQPRARVLVTTGKGTYHGTPFDRLMARMTVTGGEIEVQDATITLPGGDSKGARPPTEPEVKVSGRAALNGALGLHLHGENVSLDRVLPSVGGSGVSGRGFFDGMLQGTVSRPVVKVRAEIFNARARGHRLDLVAGDIQWRPGALTIYKAVVAQYPAQGELRGTVQSDSHGGVALNLKARLDTGRLEDLLPNANVNLDAEGNVVTTEDIRIGGTLASPTVSGRVVLTDAVVAGYPVDTAGARFRYAAGLVEATDLDAQSKFTGDGDPTIVKAKTLRLRGDHLEAPDGFEVKGIRLDRFAGLGAPYAKLKGTVNITSGTMSGSRRAPKITADVAVDGLSVNGLGFDSASAKAEFNGSAIALRDASVVRAGKNVLDVRQLVWNRETGAGLADIRRFAMPFDDIRSAVTQSEWFYGSAAAGVRHMMARLPATMPHAMVGLCGQPDDLTGVCRVTGTPSNISASGSVMMTGLDLPGGAGDRLDRLALGGVVQGLRFEKGHLAAGTITIPSRGLLAESDKLSLYGDFQGTVGGQMTASLDATSVPLAYGTLLAPGLKGSEYTPNGNVTVRVDAHGAMDAPEITASVKGQGLTVGKWKVPFSLQTGAITVSNVNGAAKIEAKSVRLFAREHAIRMWGSVPFSWRNMQIPADAPIDFHAEASAQGLDILKLAFGEEQQGPVESATGTVEASLAATGTRSNPKMTGAITVKDGAVKLRPLVSELQDINGTVQFDPKTSDVLVQALTLRSQSGGSARVLPGARLRLKTVDGKSVLEPDIRVELKGLTLDEVPDGLGLGNERFRGTFSTAAQSPLEIRQSGKGPLVAGTVILSDVSFVPPNRVVPAKEPLKAPSTTPEFDLTLVSGKNVRIGNSLYRFRVDDSRPVTDRRLRITGNPRNLRVDGRFVSRDGAFKYPTAYFKLTDAAIGVHYQSEQAQAPGSSESTAISVVANAQAKLTATLNGRRQIVTVSMHVEGPSAAGGVQPAGTFQTLAPYRITLRSSPSLPERQLVALVSRENALQALAAGTGTPEEVLRQETLNILQASVLPGALEGIESRLGAAFGLESLSVDYLSADKAVSVTAGKRIGSRMLLTYSRPLGATAVAADAYTVALSYEIGARLRLTLQQQKGAILVGNEATVLLGGSSSTVETQLLLEGSRPF